MNNEKLYNLQPIKQRYGIIGNSDGLNRALDIAIQVANTDLSVLVDRIFNENIIAMKDAAKSYYTIERLPKNVGDKVKMTLGEMLEKKINLTFTDKHGKTSDITTS